MQASVPSQEKSEACSDRDEITGIPCSLGLGLGSGKEGGGLREPYAFLLEPPSFTHDSVHHRILHAECREEDSWILRVHTRHLLEI
jgi:hypothetical protein